MNRLSGDFILGLVLTGGKRLECLVSERQEDVAALRAEASEGRLLPEAKHPAAPEGFLRFF